MKISPINWFCQIRVLLLLLVAPLSFAQDTAQPNQAVAQPAPVAGPTAVTRGAVERGILQCASRVDQLTKFLGFGPQAGALITAPGGQIDQRMFSIQMEVPAGAASNSFIDMNFAPNQANGCGASYEAISYWAQSCDALATSQYGNLKRSAAIRQDVTILEISPASKIFLMKISPTGCLSIKKEIVL